jgi:hypothetical protein
MHHCVGPKGDLVRSGIAYFYSVRKCKERIATLELVKNGGSAAIGELRGSCYSQVSKVQLTSPCFPATGQTSV